MTADILDAMFKMQEVFSFILPTANQYSDC